MRTALGLSMLMLSVGIVAVPACRLPAFAQQAGCCKDRDSLSSRNWRQNGLSLANCQRLNGKRDGDNVYAPAGFVWWDAGCR